MLETEKQLDEVIQKMAFDVGGENLLIVTQYPNSTFRSIHYNISARTAEIAEHSTTPSCDQVLNLIHNSLYCCHYAVPGHCTVYGYIIDLQFSDLLGESTPEVENGIFDWVTIMHVGSDHVKGAIYQSADHSIKAWYATSMYDYTFYCQVSNYATNEGLQTVYLNNDIGHKYMFLIGLDGATMSAHLCDMTSDAAAVTQPWTALEIIHQTPRTLSTDKSWILQAANARLATKSGRHTHRVILAVQSSNADGSISSYLIWYHVDVTG